MRKFLGFLLGIGLGLATVSYAQIVISPSNYVGAANITGQVALANGGTGAALVDPNADRILFWDDSEGAVGWLAAGNSVAITTTTLDTIQDIRTTAAPSFTGVTGSATGFALKPTTTTAHTMLLQGYDNDTGPAYVTFGTVTNGNSPSLALSAPAGGATLTVNATTLQVGGADVVAGVAAGYKVARGTITLDGSNPSTAATGLATVVSCNVSGPAAAAIPGDDPMGATPFINTTNLDIYAWKTDGTDPTPVASTNNSAVFYWVCIGT